MDNPEKLATYGTQDEEKHNTICVGHHAPYANTHKQCKQDTSTLINALQFNRYHNIFWKFTVSK